MKYIIILLQSSLSITQRVILKNDPFLMTALRRPAGNPPPFGYGSKVA